MVAEGVEESVPEEDAEERELSSGKEEQQELAEES